MAWDKEDGWHDINSFGGLASKKEESQEQSSSQDTTTSAAKEKPAPEVEFISGEFGPHPSNGYTLNKTCFVTGKLKCIKQTKITQLTIDEFGIYNNEEQNLQVGGNYRTTDFKEDGTFKFELPLYCPDKYPIAENKEQFTTPIKYRVEISHSRHKEPLKIEIDFPESNASGSGDLKKGMYDDNGKSIGESKEGSIYIAGNAVTDLQSTLINYRYLNKGADTGYFDENTEETVKFYQQDSTGKERLSVQTKKLIQAASVTYKGSVSGVVDSATRDELQQWRTDNYLRPLMELYSGEYDEESVFQKVRKRPPNSQPDQNFHDEIKPILKAQKDLQKVDTYQGGKLDGDFGPGTKRAVIHLQKYAGQGKILISGELKETGEKLTGHREGVLDIPTQIYLQKAISRGWKVPAEFQVKTLEAPGAATYDTKITIKAKEYSRKPFNTDEEKKICWCVKIDGETKKEFKDHGPTLELDIPKTWAGDEVEVYGYSGEAGSTKVKIKIGPCLIFDGKNLTLYDKDFKEIGKWPATSGLKGHTDPEKEGGPIPAGKWMVKQDQIQKHPGLIDAMADKTWDGGEDAWGKERVQVYPFGTKTNRQRMYIHGGKKAGSGFGIDLGEKSQFFVNEIRQIASEIILKVNVKSSLGKYKTSESGKQFIMLHEGFMSKPYNDSAGHATIGYGTLLHKGAVTPDDRKNYANGITKEEAKQLLDNAIVEFEQALNKAVKVELTQNQFDALMSWTYNFGPGAINGSAWLKELNAGNYDKVPAEIERWHHVKVAGKAVDSAGLLKRRKDEADLFKRK